MKGDHSGPRHTKQEKAEGCRAELKVDLKFDVELHLSEGAARVLSRILWQGPVAFVANQKFLEEHQLDLGPVGLVNGPGDYKGLCQLFKVIQRDLNPAISRMRATRNALRG